MTVPRLGLTPRQQQAFDAIVAFQATFGRTPNYQELATALGTRSKSCICWLLTALQERGYITRLPYRAYSIMIVDQAKQVYGLSPAVEATLQSYCRLTGEKPDAVVADAVTLFLDERDQRVSDDEVARFIGTKQPVELLS